MSLARTSRLVTLVVGGAFSLACSQNDATSIESQPIKGLSQATVNDSVGATPPTAPATPTPGYFHGVVRSSEGTQGPDTLGTSIKIADVAVAAYPRLASSGADTKTGPLAASTVTNSKGEFSLPELTGGEYVVTFTPPAGSKYTGVWVTATAHSHSGDFPWWVTLPLK